MLPKQLPVKTECKTIRYRSHKAATPGVKEDLCCKKKKKKKGKKEKSPRQRKHMEKL